MVMHQTGREISRRVREKRKTHLHGRRKVRTQMTAVLAVRTHGSLVARLLRREGWSHAELLGSSLDEGLRTRLNE